MEPSGPGVSNSSSSYYPKITSEASRSNTQDIELSSSEESLNEESSTSVSGIAKFRPEVVSLLSRLKSPQASELARKRRVACNPPKGKRRCRGSTVAEHKNVNPHQRVKQFPNEPLCVSNKKLFCSACREELSMK